MVSTRTRGTAQSTSTKPQKSSILRKRKATGSPTIKNPQKRAKKEIPSYLHVPPNSPNTTIPLLSHLPSELFQHILSFLTPDTQALLSLTCKSILSLIGTGPWLQCRSKRLCNEGAYWVNHRENFMPLLARDVCVEGEEGSLVYCVVCATLHSPLKPPREHRETKLTRGCVGQWNLIDYLPQNSNGQGGYSLLWNHIFSARKSMNSESRIGDPIVLLAGNFTIPHPKLAYTLRSIGRQIGKNLVLKHQHIFQATNAKSPLKAGDVLALNVQICPHQTTRTAPPGENRYSKGKLPSSLLTHSIASCFPTPLRTNLPPLSKFSVPVASEQKQMNFSSPGVTGMWSCRACPTKWRVVYKGDGKGEEVRVVVWHSFGDTPYRAQEYWKMLVRREMPLLSKEKRNSEFCVTRGQWLDFEVDEGED